MAYSKVPFTYTSGPQVFPTNFALGVLEADHIKVYVDGVVDGLGEPVEYAFTYNAANGDVTVTDALTSGQTGTINRFVPIDSLIADFEAGADVSKRNLVRAVKQTLMAVQEAADSREADSQLLQETVEDFNALADGIADDVAAIDASVLAAAGSASAAATSAGTATTQADIATTQAGLADTARQAAEAAVASASLPSIVGNALRFLRVNAAGAAYELITAATALAAIGAQAANTLLTAIAGLSSNGLIVRTGAGTAVSRSVAGTTDQIAVTNGDGVSGNPTIAAVVASQAEAEAGSNNTKLMTPLRVRQAITQPGLPAVAASGTSFDFTSIPAGVQKVHITFAGLTTSASASILVRLSDTAFVVTGYRSTSGIAGSNFIVRSSAGFILFAPTSGGSLDATLTLTRISGNRWAAVHYGRRGIVASDTGVVGGGELVLSAELTALRVTTDAADTFTGGFVKVSWEF